MIQKTKWQINGIIIIEGNTLANVYLCILTDQCGVCCLIFLILSDCRLEMNLFAFFWPFKGVSDQVFKSLIDTPTKGTFCFWKYSRELGSLSCYLLFMAIFHWLKECLLCLSLQWMLTFMQALVCYINSIKLLDFIT
jgi:hypothetical protein